MSTGPIGFHFEGFTPDDESHKTGTVTISDKIQFEWFKRYLVWAMFNKHTIDIKPLESKEANDD